MVIYGRDTLVKKICSSGVEVMRRRGRLWKIWIFAVRELIRARDNLSDDVRGMIGDWMRVKSFIHGGNETLASL